MKRILLAILTMLLMLVFFGCGGGGSGSNNNNSGTSNTTKDITVKLATSSSTALATGQSVAGLQADITYPPTATYKSIVASGVAQGKTAPTANPIPPVLKIALADVSGFALGEFATITFTVPATSNFSATDFVINTIDVRDANIQPLPNVSVTVKSVQ